jgi:uncharacterized membrane protein YgcG
MEQVERDGASRSLHTVYITPRTGEALERAVSPVLERIDPADAALQVVIITPDAETAVASAEVAYRLGGPQGIEVVPVTAASRAARLIASRPVHAVAGTAQELAGLVKRSAIKLDGVRSVVLAWADDALSVAPEAAAALETLFADLPKESARSILARRATPEVEQLIERYLRRARRVDETVAAEDSAELPPLSAITVSAASRPAALQRVLDELDPPSATVLVRTAQSRAIAELAIRQLGYRRDDDPIRISDGDVPAGTHTVIFFDAPVTAAALSIAAAAAPVQMIALPTAREAEALRELVSTVTPLTLGGPAASARQRDQQLREELASLLAHGVASRELLALEPLLDQYDGAEIAAAAVRLLERERAKAAAVAAAAATARPASPPRREREFGDRPARDDGPPRREREFGDRPPKRDFSDRPKREFSDRPKREFSDRPKRDFSDRPKREFGDRPPKRDFGDRPKRDFGDRPPRSNFGDRGPRDFSDRPKRDFGDRPAKRDFGDRPAKRDFGDRPPKRDFGGSRGSFGGGGSGGFSKGPKRSGGGGFKGGGSGGGFRNRDR